MNTRTILFFLFLFSWQQMLNAQSTFPYQRFVDWQNKGAQSIDEVHFQVLDLASFGIDASGQTDCAALFNQLITAHFNDSIVLLFPPGEFRFDHPVTLKSNIILAGAGMTQTVLNFNLGNVGSSIQGLGFLNGPVFALNALAVKGQIALVCPNHDFEVGDWVRLACNDSALVTSNWALGTVGQLTAIEAVHADTLFLKSALRRSYINEIGLTLQKIVPISQVGIKCMTIRRLDDTAPTQQSNLLLEGVVHAVIENVAFYNCTFSHVDARTSSNITVRSCYFQDGFSYGGGGRAYGVVMQATTNECLIENNIFKHLRHSILLQSGANGNVVTFNYSTDPYWEEATLPANSSGEIVLHGNFPYANLFEQNVVGNIVIDNSHGANGPDNLFYRNRAYQYGIFFSDQTSPFQLLIGNHVTNTSFPFSLVNYTVQGIGHYQFANNNKGSIVPAGTQFAYDTSFAYQFCPSFVMPHTWLSIGDQPPMLQFIPAQQRFLENNFLSNNCQVAGIQHHDLKQQIGISPNPFSNKCIVSYEGKAFSPLLLIDCHGKIMQTLSVQEAQFELDMSAFESGLYFLKSQDGLYCCKLLKD